MWRRGAEGRALRYAAVSAELEAAAVSEMGADAAGKGRRDEGVEAAPQPPDALAVGLVCDDETGWRDELNQHSRLSARGSTEVQHTVARAQVQTEGRDHARPGLEVDQAVLVWPRVEEVRDVDTAVVDKISVRVPGTFDKFSRVSLPQLVQLLLYAIQSLRDQVRGRCFKLVDPKGCTSFRCICISY